MACRLPMDLGYVTTGTYHLETFVDPVRFRGTCYRTVIWTVLGLTTDRGKDDQDTTPPERGARAFSHQRPPLSLQEVR